MDAAMLGARYNTKYKCYNNCHRHASGKMERSSKFDNFCFISKGMWLKS